MKRVKFSLRLKRGYNPKWDSSLRRSSRRSVDKVAAFSLALEKKTSRRIRNSADYDILNSRLRRQLRPRLINYHGEG